MSTITSDCHRLSDFFMVSAFAAGFAMKFSSLKINSVNHKEPRAAKPQPKIGISRAKAQRPQRKRCFPNLAFLASWRERSNVGCARAPNIAHHEEHEVRERILYGRV